MHVPGENLVGKTLADREGLDWLQGPGACSRERLDAIVFDYRTPGLDGTDVCRRIRESQPDARHVFMTGTTKIDTVYRAMEAGADRVLAKPVDPTELVHVLEEQLAGST